MAKSQYELEREANIAKNRELFENLGLQQALSSLGLPSSKGNKKSAAKPVQPSKRVKRERTEEEQPRRQSRRLLTKSQPPLDETPAERRRREKEQAEELARQEELRFEAEEKARLAKRPRHDVLNFITLAEADGPQDISELSSTMKGVTQVKEPRQVRDPDAMDFTEEKKHQAAVQEIRDKVKDLKVISRAKVTTNRIYCAAYHPEVTKDLIFFGDKHGQLGIWDARAPAAEVDDENEEIAPENREGGQYWRLQSHWPATSKSSISCIKLDPIDTHNLYTSSYDCTIRSISFVSGSSREIFSSPGVLISSMDLPPKGHEMWVADVNGGVTHLDLRESKTTKRRYELSTHKIGSVSVNPTNPHFLLTASNSRLLKVWDVRNLGKMPASLGSDESMQEEDSKGPKLLNFDSDVVTEYSQNHKGTERGEYPHDKSASSAYWDPCGRTIVSTSYDDRIRLWNVDSSSLQSTEPFPNFKPFCSIRHNCQTGKWLTILRAQWSQNIDVYPHFTVANMEHSLDIYSCKGDLITQLSDSQRISAVQAVTCSHPNIVERAASGNATGRCVLWAPKSLADS